MRRLKLFPWAAVLMPAIALTPRIAAAQEADTLSISGDCEAAAQAVTARYAFSLPPVDALPSIDGMTSTVFRRSALRAVVDNWHTDNTSAAAPDTIGVAMDVPLK